MDARDRLLRGAALGAKYVSRSFVAACAAAAVQAGAAGGSFSAAHGFNAVGCVIKRAISAALSCVLICEAGAADIPGCVTPKSKVLREGGRLEQRFISVYDKPAGRPIYVRIAAPLSVYVMGEDCDWLRIAGSPSSPFKNSEELGWVRRSEVEQQGLRNCN
jgi:hypothetical protein